MQGSTSYRVACWILCLWGDGRSHSVSVSMTDPVVILFIHGQTIYRLLTLGAIYIRMCSRGKVTGFRMQCSMIELAFRWRFWRANSALLCPKVTNFKQPAEREKLTFIADGR